MTRMIRCLPLLAFLLPAVPAPAQTSAEACRQNPACRLTMDPSLKPARPAGNRGVTMDAIDADDFVEPRQPPPGAARPPAAPRAATDDDAKAPQR